MCIAPVIAMQQDNELVIVIKDLDGKIHRKIEKNKDHRVTAFFVKVHDPETKDFAEFYFSHERDSQGKSSYYGTGYYTSKFGKVLGKCSMTKISCEGSEARPGYNALKMKYNQQRRDWQKKLKDNRKEKEEYS